MVERQKITQIPPKKLIAVGYNPLWTPAQSIRYIEMDWPPVLGRCP